MSQPEKVSNGIPADLELKLWLAADLHVILREGCDSAGV